VKKRIRIEGKVAMSRQFYYRNIKKIYYISMPIMLLVYILGGLYCIYFCTSWDFSILHNLTAILIMLLVINLFFYYDSKKLNGMFLKFHDEFKYEELQKKLYEIDSYYQPLMYNGFYNPKKVILKGMIINCLILRNKIEEAEKIHSEIISHPNRKNMKIIGELFFRSLFIRIQIEKEEIHLIEEEIPVLKKRINFLKSKKLREGYLKSLDYFQVELAYLKGKYDGLDEELISLIEVESNKANIVSKRYTLAKIYMKQGKQKEAMEQFEIVLNENHNFTKYEEAKIYYQQLQENKLQE
jgi:tetratricopeptide (TPR) repeat protein